MATIVQRYARRVPAALAAAAMVTLLSTIACSRGAERSNELAEESERLWKQRKIQQAMLRSVEAYQAAPTNAALRALADAVQNDRQLEIILDGGADATAAVAFSPKGDRLASGGDDGAIRIWDAKSWKLLRTIDADGERVAALAFTHGGNRIYSSDGALVRRWDPATGEESGPPLDAKRGNVEAMAMHPGGRWLVAGYSRGFVVWDLGQQPPRATPLPDDASQRGSALAFDEDGERLVVVEGGKTLKRGTFRDGVFKVSFKATSRAETTAVTIMNLTIAAGTSDGRVQRLQDYTMFPERQAIVHKAPVRAVALEHHGVYLASGSDDGRVLVTYGWQEPEPFDIRKRVRAIAWDPTARRLVVAGDGSSLYVLHPTQRQPLARVLRHEGGGIRQVSFDTRGEVAATTDEPVFPELQGVRRFSRRAAGHRLRGRIAGAARPRGAEEHRALSGSRPGVRPVRERAGRARRQRRRGDRRRAGHAVEPRPAMVDAPRLPPRRHRCQAVPITRRTARGARARGQAGPRPAGTR